MVGVAQAELCLPPIFKMKFCNVKQGQLIQYTRLGDTGKKRELHILVISDLITKSNKKNGTHFETIETKGNGKILKELQFLRRCDMNKGMKVVKHPDLAEKMLNDFTIECL